MDEDRHPSLEAMADWLAARLPHEEVLALLPHLFAGCPVCRQRFQEVRRLQQEVGHWDEAIAVREGLAATAQLEALAGLPFAEQVRRVEAEPEHQSWGLSHLLVERSAAAVFTDAAQAADFAELAVWIAERLSEEAYHPDWVGDLRARAWAAFGNAQRVLGELRGADAAFRRTLSLLAGASTGDPRLAAEVWDLEASLRRAQRRLPEALDLLAGAVAVYRELGDRHCEGRALLNKAKTLEEMGETEAAIEVLRGVPALLDPGKEPRLGLYARQHLVWCLAVAGHPEEAAELLSELRQLFRTAGNRLDLIRFRWVEGVVAHARGQAEAAEAAFQEVQRDFLDEGLGYDAALAALDLAALYAEQGRTADLKRLAAEVTPVFLSREVHREAMAAILMFQHACEEETLTAGLARHLARLLATERRPRKEDPPGEPG